MGVSDFMRFNPSQCLLPKEGPMSLRYLVTFVAASTEKIELLQRFQDKTVSIIQTVYFYNPNNFPVIVISDDTNQTLIFPPNKFGYIPIMVSEQGNIRLTSEGAGNLELHFINVPVYPIIADIVSLIL